MLSGSCSCGPRFLHFQALKYCRVRPVLHLRGQVHRREQIGDEPQEDGRVCADDFGGVEVSQCSHQHGLLVDVGVAALELAGH